MKDKYKKIKQTHHTPPLHCSPIFDQYDKAKAAITVDNTSKSKKQVKEKQCSIAHNVVIYCYHIPLPCQMQYNAITTVRLCRYYLPKMSGIQPDMGVMSM